MKLILINGQSGTGKTDVGKFLLKEIENSAFIDVDNLIATSPWKFGGKYDHIAIKNAVSLINNFLEFGFGNIIISGLTRNQELLDEFLLKLNVKAEVLFVWLKADNEIRNTRKENRARDGADKVEVFELIDKIYPDIQSINLENGKSIFIDTTSKSIKEVVLEIKNQFEGL